jgi:hypothetical protein
VSFEIRRHYPPKILFRRTVRRSVIVGEIEMGDAVIEGAVQDGTPGFKDVVTAEFLPGAGRYRRQFQPRTAQRRKGIES